MTTKRPYLLLLPASLWRGLAILALAASLWAARRAIDKDPTQWTLQDAQQILTVSPWAQEASASFATASDEPQVPIGPMPDPLKGGRSSASDGRWDGGVGRKDRGGTPTLTVMIRWDSALPVRQALIKTNSAGYAAEQVKKDYVVTVLGLAPGGNYRAAGRLDTESTSGDAGSSRRGDPEEMLEGLMARSRLLPRGKPPIAPEDVKLDAATGAIHLFFPRTQPIALRDKEVMFATRFGSMTVQKRFHLKDMIYQGRLEL